MENKIWMRLGGFVTCPKEDIAAILDGDEATLLKLIRQYGFELNGDSYIPEDLSPDGYEIDFEFDGKNKLQ